MYPNNSHRTRHIRDNRNTHRGIPYYQWWITQKAEAVATRLEIKLHDAALEKGEGSLIEVGNYKITVKLECHGLHKAQGNGTGVFYGFNSISYDRSTDKIVSGAPLKVWEWDHTQTFSGR